MVWQYFEALRRLVHSVQESDDDSIRRQNIAICIFMGVTVVETFLNVFFRVAVCEEGRRHREKEFLDDLDHRRSLDYKIKNWPSKILGQEIDLRSGIGGDFSNLKDKRNSLMHFTSTHDTLNIGGLVIKGVADTSAFDNLVPDDAVFALKAAEGIIALILRMNGATDKQLPWAIQQWTGKVPIVSRL
jgi:hypothetical protein